MKQTRRTVSLIELSSVIHNRHIIHFVFFLVIPVHISEWVSNSGFTATLQSRFLKAQSHRNNWWIAYAPRIKLVYPRFMRAKKMAFSLTCRRWIACKTRTRPKFSYISRGNGSFCGCITHGSLIIHVCIPYNSRMKCAWVTNETRVWRMKYGRNAHDSLMNHVWFKHRTRIIHLWIFICYLKHACITNSNEKN